MNINDKHFLNINIIILIISSILIFYGIDDSIQESIIILKSFSFSSLLLIIRTVLLALTIYIFLFFILRIFKATPIKHTSKHKYSLLILCWILYFISLTLILAKKWAEDRFPMQQPEIIFPNLLHINKATIDQTIIIESVIIIFISFIISFSFFAICFFIQTKTKYTYLSTKIIKKIKLFIKKNSY